MTSVLLSQVVMAKVDTKKLVNNVETAIGRYYTETFDIKAESNGKIILGGEVNSMYDRIRIFDIVSTVPGVMSIENRLIVDTPELPDDIIMDNIQTSLGINPAIQEPDRIKVAVSNGLVMLSGEVSNQREKTMAETVVSWQQGVKGIENDIEVLSHAQAVSDENLTIILNEIMKNQFHLYKKVTFTIADGVVTLKGTAPRLWDKNKIAEEFIRVMGAKKAVNNVTVITDDVTL